MLCLEHLAQVTRQTFVVPVGQIPVKVVNFGTETLQVLELNSSTRGSVRLPSTHVQVLLT